MKTLSSRTIAVVLSTLAVAGCSLIAHYDQVAYEHATSAKVDTLALMDKATGSYDSHEKEIDALVVELDKAYEYDRGRGLNKLSIAQWEILRDPNGDLVGGFLRMWKTKGSMSATFIKDKKRQIARAFDQIIGLEGGKQKSAEPKE